MSTTIINFIYYLFIRYLIINHDIAIIEAIFIFVRFEKDAGNVFFFYKFLSYKWVNDGGLMI